jgi:hypothetical protein
VASSGRPRWQIVVAAIVVLALIALVLVLLFVPADRIVEAPTPAARSIAPDVRVAPAIEAPAAPEGFVPLYPQPAPTAPAPSDTPSPSL